MNILMLANAFPPTYMGGESQHLLDLACGLTSRGHRVVVVHPSPSQERQPSVRYRKESPSLDVYRICLPEGPPSNDRMNELLVDLVQGRILRGEKIDLIHCHSNRFLDGLSALQAGRPLPLVTTVHAVHVAIVSEVMRKKGVSPDPAEWALYTEELERQSDLCRRSDRIVAISRAMSSHVARYFQADPSRVRVVYNGIDHGRFAAAEGRLKAGEIRRGMRLEGRMVVLYAGRIEPVKGIGPLAEACSRLCSRRDDVAFVFLGNGSGDGWLRSRLRGHGRVHFVDWLDLEGIVPYYHLADVAVVPSLIEPFGLVPLEAMACRTCVICSNADGMDETVVHEESGFKVPLVVDPDGDRRIEAEEIENAIERAIRDPEWRLRLADGGVRRAAEFTTDRMALETEKVYSELLG